MSHDFAVLVVNYGICNTIVLEINQCDSFEDQILIDEIYRCLIFKWIAVDLKIRPFDSSFIHGCQSAMSYYSIYTFTCNYVKNVFH